MRNMTNVKLTKDKKGWVLAVEGDLGIKMVWAITSEELWELHKVIEDNMVKILEEMGKEK